MIRILLFGALVASAGGLRPPAPDSDGVRAAPRSCEAAVWRPLIARHIARYDGMGVTDLYKLVHQAVLGAGHAAPSPQTATTRLENEIAVMGGGPAEPTADTLGTGSLLARVHLRPFVSGGGDVGALAAAFVTTAGRAFGDETELACVLDVVRDMADRGRLPWSRADVDRYLAARAREGYPAVHHSPSYEARHRPAYRLVAVDLVRDLVPDLIYRAGEPIP